MRAFFPTPHSLDDEVLVPGEHGRASGDGDDLEVDLGRVEEAGRAQLDLRHRGLRLTRGDVVNEVDRRDVTIVDDVTRVQPSLLEEGFELSKLLSVASKIDQKRGGEIVKYVRLIFLGSASFMARIKLVLFSSKGIYRIDILG